MSDFRGILRGIFISDQYRFRKYRACFSPFHCCFDNSSIRFRSIFAFQKKNTGKYFFQEYSWKCGYSYAPSFSQPPLTLSSLSENLVWEDSCRSSYGAAGGSGTHCNHLSWPLSQLETKVTTL
ncbi:unnamed protein product [Pipistrellus nathusii]|uniref:Uncharacterized protein n=1 Tax=Pipistrellus nathusii TaxID=59473 RepID=A0ABP0AHB7_PIPNA